MENKVRRTNHLAIIAIIWLIILSFFVGSAHCQTVTGNAVYWFDGDTIKFRQSNGKYKNVRLVGIDAPESRQTFGIEAKNKLIELTKGKSLSLQIAGVDTYKRTLGYLFSAEVEDINLEMIALGFAWEYSAPLSVRTSYQNAEQSARDGNLGLWLDNSPMAPQSFRNKCSQ